MEIGVIVDSPVNILIVDDEQMIARCLQIALQCHGYNTTITNTGYKALQVVREECFHIAVIDIGMPAMNGIELMSNIRSASPLTKIILMTAYDYSHHLVKQAITKKPDDLVYKPFDPILLVSIVDHYSDLSKLIEPAILN